MATTTATLRIRARVIVTKWTPKPRAFAKHLANDPIVKRIVGGVADDIVWAAKIRVGTSPKSPKGAKYPKINGAYWSASPQAVGREIRVKDVTTKFPRTRSFQYDIMVGLVVADHPYSQAYERGGLGIRANKFMRRAANGVIARNPALSRKSGLRKVN